MATREELEYLVQVQDRQLKDLQREIRATNKALGRDTATEVRKGEDALRKHADTIRRVSLVALAGLAFAGVKAVGAASDLNESINKADATFRKSSPAIQKWSKNAASSLGLSRQAALENAASIGAMLGPMGIADKQSASMSKRMVQLAADMASFNNEDPTEMLDRIRSGLAGESEPLRRFGSNLSDARVKAFAYAHGIAATGVQLTDAQKIQARYGLLLQDTNRQQGDFARTSGGVANQQRILKARTQDLAAQLGAGLLPAVNGLLGGLVAVAGFFSKHTTLAKVLVGVVAALAGGFLALSFAVKATTIAMTANPIGLVVGALAALVTALVYAYTTSATFRAIVSGALSAVGTAAQAVAGFFAHTLPDAFGSVLDWLKSNWPIIATIISGPFAPLVALATDAFGIRSGLMGALDWLKNAAGTAAGEVSGAVKRGFLAVVWDFPRLLFDRVIQPMVSLVSSVVARAAALSSSVPRGIASVAWGLATLFYDRVVQPLANLVSTAADKGGDIAGAIGRGIRDGIGAVTDAVKGAFARFLNAIIRVINILPFVDIPPVKLAEGGVVRGPTFALVGEDGPEVVIPLGRKRRRRGKELLGQAASIMGLEGDGPGPVQGGSAKFKALASMLGLPMFGLGGWIKSGARWAGGKVKDGASAVAGFGADAAKSAWGGVQSVLKLGLKAILSKLPGLPSWPDDGGIVSGFGAWVKDAAVEMIKGWFGAAKKQASPLHLSAQRWAEAQMGKPYVWGGGHGGWNFNLGGYDCSGFASHAAKLAGALLGGPGTTMSLFPSSSSGSGPVTWGFRGMGSSSPRSQHMGIRLLGSWYQFGNPGHKGGGDSQWESLHIPPGLPSYQTGTAFVPRTGLALLHRGEAVVPAERNRSRFGGGPLVNVERLEVRSPVDADVIASSLSRRLVLAGVFK